MYLFGIINVTTFCIDLIKLEMKLIELLKKRIAHFFGTEGVFEKRIIQW